ncbi:MAG TPA: lipocalin-like domain-containing protein [Nitrospiria bacterium]|nr:lipocalin-like domain-containing protein [Nitrospiria bacterium]
MSKILILSVFFHLLTGITIESWARAEGFRTALPGYRLSFPRDHGAHEEFQTEWWYYTGHLHTADGKSYGYELTFFRKGNREPIVIQNPSRWSVRDLYLAHFALTDPSGNRFWYREKISREGLGKAGAESNRLLVHIDDWRAESIGDKIVLTAREEGNDIRLELTSEKPVVLQGHDGLSQKGPMPGEASYYYSLTRLRTSGMLRINGAETRVDGLSWMDHEFFSTPKNDPQGPDQYLSGWDWFAIQLDNRCELMFYRLRERDGSNSPFSAGSLILPDGTTEPLSLSKIRLTPLSEWKSLETGATYPIRWKLEVPEKKIALNLEPLLPQQELVTPKSTRVVYWEGALRAEGSWRGAPVSGEGYLEMTGYGTLSSSSGRGIKFGPARTPVTLSPPTK